MSKAMKIKVVLWLVLLFALMVVLLAAIEATSAQGDQGSMVWMWEMPRVSVWPETHVDAQETLVRTFTSPVLVPDVDFIFRSPVATPEAP